MWTLRKQILATVTCAGLLAACSSDSDNDDNNNGTKKTAIRVAHLVPAATNVRLCLYTSDGVRGPIPGGGDGIAYGSVSDYSTEQIAAQTAYTAKVFASSITTCPAAGEKTDNVAETSIPQNALADGGKYTLNVLPPATSGSPTLKVVRDDEDVANSRAKVRATHALTNSGNAIPALTICYNDSLLGDNSAPIATGLAFSDTSPYNEQNASGANTANLYAVNSSDAQGCKGTKIVERNNLGGTSLPVGALINAWIAGDIATSVEASKPRIMVSVDSFE